MLDPHLESLRRSRRGVRVGFSLHKQVLGQFLVNQKQHAAVFDPVWLYKIMRVEIKMRYSEAAEGWSRNG